MTDLSPVLFSLQGRLLAPEYFGPQAAKLARTQTMAMLAMYTSRLADSARAQVVARQPIGQQLQVLKAAIEAPQMYEQDALLLRIVIGECSRPCSPALEVELCG